MEVMPSTPNFAYAVIPSTTALLSVVSVTRSQLWSKNIKWENSRNEQFVSFKLCVILSSEMKCHTVLLHPL